MYKQQQPCMLLIIIQNFVQFVPAAKKCTVHCTVHFPVAVTS